MSNSTQFIPPLIPISNYDQPKLAKPNMSPPPLEIDKESIKENIPPLSLNSTPKKKRKKSLYGIVPPLEILIDEPIDEIIDETIDKTTGEPIDEQFDEQIDEQINITNNNQNIQNIQNEEEEIEIESGNIIENINPNEIGNEIQNESLDTSIQNQTENNEEILDNNNDNNTNSEEISEDLDENGFPKIKMVQSSGRLLESEEDWYKRPKISYSASGQMVFRPLRMKCTHCNEAYTKTHDLYAHIRTHQHHTKCPHCGKILTCMATFVYHVRTHTAEKPYYCPCTGCDFKNAVKYNLKVHLACIRHGGKANLKKYAKILDLDVCEKSLRKRKDNSVHELGSRRSKKRRKLNNGRHHNHNHHHNHHNNHNNHHHHHQTSVTEHFKQEEYDQFATKLLFSLSTMPPFDPQAMNLIDWGSMINPQTSTTLNDSSSSSLIKIENSVNNMENINNEYILKPEQQYYDPLYGYYTYTNPHHQLTNMFDLNLINSINNNNNNNKNEIKLNNNNNNNNNNEYGSLSTSTIWSGGNPQYLQNDDNINNHNNNNNNNNDTILIPKQEPIYDYSQYVPTGYDPHVHSHSLVHPHAHSHSHQHPLNPSNIYYGNSGYFLNYDNHHHAHHVLYPHNNSNIIDQSQNINQNQNQLQQQQIVHSQNQLQQNNEDISNNNDNNSNNIEVPPLPMTTNETTS